MVDSTLEFIIKMRDEASGVLKNITAQIDDHADSHKDLANAASTTSQALNEVAAGTAISSAAHDTAADAVDGHKQALDEQAESLENVAEKSDSATGAMGRLMEAIFGVSSTAAALKQMEFALTGVSAASAAIRTETIMTLEAALEGVGNKAAILKTVEEGLEGVNSRGAALRVVADGLVDVGNKDAILANLSSVLADVSHKTEGASVANKVLRASMEEAGMRGREFSAEAGILGEVLGDFGLKGFAAAIGVAAVTAAVTEGIKNFSEYQDMVERFQTNQMNSGRSMSFSDLHDTSEGIAQNSTFGADSLDEAGTSIAKFASLSGDEVKQVMQISADVAAGTGQNIQQVAAQLGRAFEEPLRGAMMLRQYIGQMAPEVREEMARMDKSGDFEGERQLLAEQLEGMYKGQAEAMQRTLGGAFEVLGTGIEEAFSNGLGAVGALINAFTPLRAVVLELGKGLEDVGSEFNKLKALGVLYDGSATSNLALARQNVSADQSNLTSLENADPNSFANSRARLLQIQRAQDSVNFDNQQISRANTTDPNSYLYNPAPNSTIGDSEKLVGNATDEALKVIPDANKIEQTKDAIAGMQAALETLNPKASANTDTIHTLTTALEYLKGTMNSLTDAVGDAVSKLMISAQNAALVGGDKGLQADALQLGTAYAKQHTDFEPSAPADQRNYDASQLPDIRAQAMGPYADQQLNEIRAANFTTQQTNPYLKEESSKDPQVAAAAKAAVDAIKEALTRGGQSGFDQLKVVNGKVTGTPTDAMGQVALQAYDTAYQNTLRSESASKGGQQDPATKQFSDISDVTASADAYNRVLETTGSTIGSAKLQQEAYTEAQKASSEGTISFNAALTQAIALLQQRNAATAESTALELEHTNAQAAAVNAAIASGGAMAGKKAQLTFDAQNQGLTGSAATQYVNDNLTKDQNSVNAQGDQQLYDLKQQIAQLESRTKPVSPDVQSILDQANKSGQDQGLTDKLVAAQEQYDKLQASAKAAQEATQQWTNVGIQGFNAMGAGLAKVIEGTGKWGQTFGQVAKEIADQILQLAIQQELLSPLEAMLGLTPAGAAGSGGGSGGGLLGSVFSGAEGLFGGSTGSTIAGYAKSAGSSILSGVETAGSFISSFFADGGISGAGVQGSIPLKMYAAGGVANSPQMSVFGEAGPEAYVPLADGRSIPVTMKSPSGGGGGGAAFTNHFNVSVNTGAPPQGASSEQHAAMVGQHVASNLEAMVVKVIQDQQRSGGALNRVQ